ncbi:MAG: DUF2442 domain-containing protein [Anaerolineae bacterium]|nr:DUF2442 domain-containing protein [Anaerolineae bacterium]
MGDMLDGVYLAANEIASAEISPDELIVKTVDGRTIHTPLSWFPFLVNASEEQRQNFRILGWVIDWEELEDGVSMETILLGRPERKNHASTEVEPVRTTGNHRTKVNPA